MAYQKHELLGTNKDGSTPKRGPRIIHKVTEPIAHDHSRDFEATSGTGNLARDTIVAKRHAAEVHSGMHRTRGTNDGASVTSSLIDDEKMDISPAVSGNKLGKARAVLDFPRQCVLWGTTNERDYLRSQTGNRRFIPVRVPAMIDIEGLRINRDGLWSEAVEAEAAGFPITMPEHLWDAARAAQELRTRKDPLRDRVGRLHEYLPGNADARGVYAVNDTEERVASRWIMDDVLQIPIKDQTPEFASRLRSAMEAEGWQYNDKTMRIGKRAGRGYKRAIPDFGI